MRFKGVVGTESMRINVAQLLQEQVGSQRQYSLEDSTAEGHRVSAQLTLVRTNRSILVKGRCAAGVNSICSRCLEEYEQALELDIEEEFFPARDIVTGAPTQLTENAEGFVIQDDHVLDLGEALRQNIEVNIPARLLCRVGCAGLCHQCGSNLNQGPCHCSPELVDPRWNSLRELSSRSNGRK